MKKIVFAVTLALSGAVFAGPVVAMPASPLTAPSVLGDLQQVQYIYGGRNYCWYNNGWRGPGYYWCGYAMRRGFGWGGGDGWRGWRGGGRGPGFGHGPRGGYGGGRGGGGGHGGGHGGHR